MTLGFSVFAVDPKPMYGLPEILKEFPRAEPIALAESIPAMDEQVSPAYLKVWNEFFPGRLTSTPVAPGPMEGTTITIGGSTATVIPVGSTDTGHSSVVHVPRLGLVVSGDVVYNRTHMWLQGSTPESRAGWVDALSTVAALEAGTLIAGHRHPQAGDDDAGRQIDESRRYIADFENALASSRTPAELIDRMMKTYSNLANPYTLWVAAYDQLGSAPT